MSDQACRLFTRRFYGALRRNKRAPECAYAVSNNNWKNCKQRIGGNVIPWIANAKDKTLALTVHALLADVYDMALV